MISAKGAGAESIPGLKKDETTGPSGELLLRLASWRQDTVVDGPGLRFTVFAQGCPHRCPGCHNPETHLPLGGSLISVQELFQIYAQGRLTRGITLSGGEPFAQAAGMAALASSVREAGGDVVTYSGYVYENLLNMSRDDPAIRSLLDCTDLLIDGPFILSLRCLDLPFRGSRNQRLLALSEKGEKMLAEIGGC